MNSTNQKIPDFAEIREQALSKLTYPCIIDYDEDGIDFATRRHESLCSALNEIVTVYQRSFNFLPGYEFFKENILPLVLKMPAEKVLDRDLRARWIAEQGISVKLDGRVKLKKEKELSFLLDSVDFPKELDEVIHELHRLIGKTFVPDHNFRDLYDEKQNRFSVGKKVQKKIMEGHSIIINNERAARVYYLRHQLADALNGLYDCGLGVPDGDLTRHLLQLLTPTQKVKPYDSNRFMVDKRELTRENFKVEIVPDSVVDRNEYDEDGRPRDEYVPVTVSALVNGIPQKITIPQPELIIPAKSNGKAISGGKDKPFSAREIAEDPSLLRELVFNKAAVKMKRENVS